MQTRYEQNTRRRCSQLSASDIRRTAAASRGRIQDPDESSHPMTLRPPTSLTRQSPSVEGRRGRHPAARYAPHTRARRTPRAFPAQPESVRCDLRHPPSSVCAAPAAPTAPASLLLVRRSVASAAPPRPRRSAGAWVARGALRRAGPDGRGRTSLPPRPPNCAQRAPACTCCTCHARDACGFYLCTMV